MSILKVKFAKPVDTGALGLELTALALPGLGVVSRLSRKTDADGKRVFDKDGRPIAVPPYVMIESDPLTPAQVAMARAAVAGHVPPLPEKPVDVLSELVDVLVAKGALAMADFSPDAKVEIADRKGRRR